MRLALSSFALSLLLLAQTFATASDLRAEEGANCKEDRFSGCNVCGPKPDRGR